MTENGRIKLTWQQLTWGLAMVVILVTFWSRTEMRLDAIEALVKGVYTKAEIDALKRDADRVHEHLQDQINDLKRARR